MEEVGIELDCEDVTLVEDAGEKYFELICDLVRLQNVEHKLVARGFNVISAEVNMRALHTIAINESDSAKVRHFPFECSNVGTIRRMTMTLF